MIIHARPAPLVTQLLVDFHRFVACADGQRAAFGFVGRSRCTQYLRLECAILLRAAQGEGALERGAGSAKIRELKVRTRGLIDHFQEERAVARALGCWPQLLQDVQRLGVGSPVEERLRLVQAGMDRAARRAGNGIAGGLGRPGGECDRGDQQQQHDPMGR
jgi:hypothetical protein